MPFDENLIKQNREKIGQFFASRRAEMGHSVEQAAAHIGITVNTLSRIEQGKFHWDIDLHLKICKTYELKPFLVPLEYLKPHSPRPKFILCPDEKTGSLYILHRDFPECLIEVIQTIPVTFEIKDIYALSSEHEIYKFEVLQQAKQFFHDHIANQDLN